VNDGDHLIAYVCVSQFRGENVLRFQYNLPEDGDFDQLRRLTEMAIYYIDRVTSLKMSPQVSYLRKDDRVVQF